VASAVQICNLALTKLGAARITDLLDDTKQAQALNAIYDATRDAELAAHPWTFAITRAEIPALSTAPAYGWARAYQKPAGTLRLVEVGQFYALYDTGGQPGFELEGETILTDEGSPLQIRYVQRITNTGLFAPLFVQSFSCRLAFEVCEGLTQNLSKREAAWKERNHFIAEAKRTNAIERPPQRPQDLSWVREMTGVGNG
jgi:hypothetical protein